MDIKIPEGTKLENVHLLVSGQKPAFEVREDKIILSVPQI
jgi:hypothetical protein